LGGRKGIQPGESEWSSAGVVTCLERGADLHMAQLMQLPLTVSCFSNIQIGFTFLVPAHPVVTENKRVCMCLDRSVVGYRERKVCRYNWQSAGSLGWPFPMLKYKYIFQTKYTETVLSNSTRKQL